LKEAEESSDSEGEAHNMAQSIISARSDFTK